MTYHWIVRSSVCLVLALLPAWPAHAQIADTKHNLSVSGPGPIRSTTEEEICIFCHTPHRARTDVGILWNRPDSPVPSYSTYQSSSLLAAVGQPNGASKLCLSCHDGTIALGTIISRPDEVPFAGGIRFMPEGESLLGTDLSDDHPISFLYDDLLAQDSGELVSPSTLNSEVRLDGLDRMQCTACHDPHDDTLGKFLRRSMSFSALCVTCHQKTDWAFSSHANSVSTWTGIAPDPWPHSAFETVAENACENCHHVHGAGGARQLLNFAFEEDNCLSCHNGNVATTDIESELTKLYRHGVQDTVGVHAAAEDFTISVPNHVECVDCHNPHRVSDLVQSAPFVSGTQLGVTGISSSGMQVDEASFADEICYKCHADNNVITFVDISRQLPQINTRLEFDMTNPSFHPIQGPGQNANVPSLLNSPYNENSVIYCTDCHNNDSGPANGGLSPAGPHGSVYDYLLERNYTVIDNAAESAFAYALCYKCHDRDSILGNDSFSEHDRHIRGDSVSPNNTPCSACHDPHGVSATQGNAFNNTHLINFDLNIVSPNANGLLEFEDLGSEQGRCYLNCHGYEHDPAEYP
jgi:predicted CXXCH cytochrome family protein